MKQITHQKGIYVVLCWASICGYLQADLIKTTRGELKNIVIQKETYKNVVYYYQIDSKKNLQTVEIAQIVQIERTNKNPNYEIGEENFQQGQYAQAILAYTRAMAEQNWAEQHALFKIAKCHQLQRHYSDAIKAYRVLHKKFPDSYYLPESYLNLAQCFIGLQKWKDAGQALQQAAVLYEETKKEAELIETNYWKGMAQERQSKFAAAIPIYEIIANTKGEKYQAWKQKASLRLAQCWIQTGEDKKAREGLLTLLNKSGNPALMAGIYVGLGHMYLKTQDVKKALMCFLRVATLYSDDTEYGPTAFNKAAYCFDLLKDQNPDYRSRARQLKEMSRQKYGQ